ncbi:FMN-binding negative transcriptional regulator [Leptobacterium flavescens]|uniref:FMN-binding negative transcriptional regulator n=1 Tax=Leptobacterium flavescens TaxID=472055 RepID=A0A6P0UG84_9FLAO|nr:FMN-binding negative transcriptional regulator [Leptobacterium flavescens]NER12027.1 FMN-binding negative transcriptional regulator [Leptobacterium flavescens]
MYIPEIYRNTNLEDIADFIHENGFGIIVNHTGEKLWATHIPLELTKNEAGKDVLIGHVSRGNLQWKNLENDNEVLVIFHGPHTYVSSSWYDHENVPTWNYIAVHVYGKMRLLDNEELWQALKRLIDKYEKTSEKPIKMEELSSKMVKTEMRGIKGIEIEIESVDAAFKLSQNRDAKNHSVVREKLNDRGDDHSAKIAEEMKKHFKG